ncbi:MAG: FadD3 family acyl-CoA ligase [Parvibaculales bacterium]
MKTIPQTLVDTAAAAPEALALIDDGWHLSYQDLLAQVLKTAGALKKHGLGHGDRFAIWAPNCAEWVITALAGQSLGAVMVTLNTRYKGAEAADIIRRSKCKILLTVNGFLGVDYPALLAGEDLPELKHTIIIKDATNISPLTSFIEDADPIDLADLDLVSSEDLSDIIFTSGTTGAPKGAMTTHGQNVAVFDTFSNAIGMMQGDRYLIVNPFFHSFGYKAGWLCCLIQGAAIYPLSVFDVEDVLRRIEQDKITVMPGAPTIFQSLLAHEKLLDYDISSLRVATTGAAVIPVDLIAKMTNELGIDHVYSAYGLTESSGVVTLCSKGDDFETIATTCGKPLANTEVRLVDDAGIDVAADEEGEIWVRGFNVMKGYLDNPEATAETITADGWLKTGDIGRQDARGYIRITDRKKDMIIVGGFNCYPAEVEQSLMLHKEIADVAVTGMDDERLGEVARAYIVKTPGSDISQDAIISWARETLANFKVPRKIDFVETLPRNASGKVQKFLLPD